MSKFSRQLTKQYRGRYLSGATSLYVVVFAALLFTIITVGFVTIIMSEVSQTVNDELSQSAYDSALAGIEDAKLAILKCRNAGADPSCAAINTSVGDSNTDYGCQTVATILGRDYSIETGVLINEVGDNPTAASAETLQAYTCVTVKSTLPDYRSYLSSSDTDILRLVPLRAASPATNDNITGIRISWYASSDNNSSDYRNINQNGRVVFAPVSSGISAPPTISVQLIQTDQSFTLSSNEIDYTEGSNTDRGTVFLVPTNISVTTSNNFIVAADNHIANYGTSNSQSGAALNPSSSVPSGFLKANDKSQSNLPYVIECDTAIGSEFACSATIELPSPVSGDDNKNLAGVRNDGTSLLIISMPYTQPSTDFSIELCNDTGTGSDTDTIRGNCSSTIDFEGVQYAVDSTGRANDVYNRVEARIELSDIYFPTPKYAVQLTGTGETLVKNFWATASNCWYSNNGYISYCPTNHLSGILSSGH